MTPALAALIAELEKAIAEVPPQEAPAAIGELGRAMATLLGRAMANSASDTPEAGEEDLQLLSVPKVAPCWTSRRPACTS